MAENSNLSFFNPAEPLGGKGVIDAPSTDPLNLQPFEGRPALQDPKINFPTPSIISPLELRENIIGSPGTRTAADKGTISPRQKNVSDYQRMQLLASMAFTPDTPKTGVFAYDASHRSNTFYKRYHAYGQEKFDKIGFHPLLNNEANFNANTTIWNDFGRMLNHSFVPLFANGFVAGPKSLFRAMQGDFGTDTNDARIFAEAAAIGQSNKGGLGGFTSNLLMNFAYTAGIVTEAAIEMGVAALLAAPSGGASIGAAGLNLGSRSFTLGRLMGTTSKIKSGLNTTQAINATRNFNAVKNAKIVGTTLSEAQNINNARQIFNWAKIDAGLGSSVGQFLNPLSQLTDGISAGMTASKNLTGWAKTWAITSNTAGGLYRNAVALNASLAEARLEGGMVENDVYYELVQNHYKTNDEDPTNEQLNAFKKQSQAAGMTALAANAGVIYVSNKIVFDNIFGGKNPIGKLMGRMGRKTQDVLNLKTGTLVRTTTKQTLKTTGKVIAKPTVEFIEKNLQNTLKAWYKEPVFTAGKKTIGYFKANILEGLQENTQEIIADATKNYYIESFKNPSLANSQFAYAQFKHAYDQQFTKQGLETFLSGFAMGFPARGLNYTIDYAGRMAERISDPVKYKEEIAKQKTYTQQLVNTLNNTTLLDFYTNPSFHYGSQAELRKQILQSSDENVRQKLIAESVQMESFIKSMTMAMKHNTMDLYYDQFEAYKDLTQAEFEEAFGLKDGEGKDYLANLSQMQERAKNIETRWNEATERFPIPEDIEDMIDSLPANSAELEQVHLMLAAWNEAKTNYVFFNESFTEVEKQIQKTTQAIKTVLSKYNVNLSDIQLLYEPQLLKTELAYLKRDIDLLTGMEQLNEEQQEQLVQAKEKLETLSALNDAIRNQEVSVIDKKDIIANLKLQLSLSDESEEMGLSEEDIESIANNLYEKNELSLNKTDLELEIAFKNYIRTLTQEEDAELDNQVFNQALDEAASEFYNFMKLSAEKKKLAAVINTINDPQGYMDMVERNMLWMKELYDQRRGYYEEMIRKGFQGIEDNAILNKLAEMNIYISSEALEEWSTKNKIPEEFFDQNKEIVIKQGHHRYGEYEGLFVRALQNAARQKRDFVPQQFQDRINELELKRKAALEQLSTTEQKTELLTIDFNNKEKTLDKIKDSIPNETYVELTYTENKEEKTLILYRDAKGVFRYVSPDGNVFDQPKLKFKTGEVYKLEEKPDPAEEKEINDKYNALIAQVRAEGKAYERKTGNAFEDITVDTPFEKIPRELQQILQMALLEYKESIGQPLGEDASLSEEDIIDFIANNPIASQLINDYNKIRRAQEVDKDSNFDVVFVDKEGNEVRASELSPEELDAQIKVTLLEIKELKEKGATEESLTLEETLRLSELSATYAGLASYKDFLVENKFTDAQIKVRNRYNKAVKSRQSEISVPDKTKNHYTLANTVLTRVSNLVKDLQYLPFINEDLLELSRIYDKVFSKDSKLTLDKYNEFVKEFNSEILQGYSVETNKTQFFAELKSIIGQKLDKDILSELFNKFQFEESRTLGKYIHNGIENLINGEPVAPNKDIITSEAYEELFGAEGIITKLVKEDLKDVMILGTENVVFNEQYAGTMDLILVDKNGKVFIVDIKTTREDKWQKYNKPGNASREAHTLQLTAYKNLLFNLTGIEAEIAVLPVKIKYNKEGIAESASFPTEVPGLLKEGKKTVKLDSTESFGEKSVQTLIDENIPRKAPAQVTPSKQTTAPAQQAAEFIETSKAQELVKMGVPEALISSLTEEEITNLSEITNDEQRQEKINALRVKYMDDLLSIKDKIFSIQERRESVLEQLQDLQSKLNSIEAFLDNAYENTENNFDIFLNKVENLEKAFNVRFKSLTELKSKKAKNTREQIAQARKLLKEEAKDIIALSEITRKVRQDIRTLEVQNKDLTNQLKYYQALQKKYGDVVDLTTIENKIKTINRKLSTLQKVIKVLSDLLSKANDLFKSYFESYQKANSNYAKTIKDSGFKPMSPQELNKLIKSEDPMDQQKLSNYLDLAKHVTALEKTLNEEMDKVETADDLIKQEDTLLKTRIKEYERFANQVRYLEELVNDIFSKDNKDTISETLPGQISSIGEIIKPTPTKFYGTKTGNKPFATRKVAQSQLDRVSAETKIPKERLVVIEQDNGFVIVESSEVKESTQILDTFTVPVAQVNPRIAAAKKEIVTLNQELDALQQPTAPVSTDAKADAQTVKNRMQEIEKQPVSINVTTDASGKMEQTSEEVVSQIKSELDKIGLPYSDVVANDKGSTYFVVTKDGQQHEILKLVKTGNALVKPVLTKAKWINHLIKTQPQDLYNFVNAELKALDQSTTTVSQTTQANIKDIKQKITNLQEEVEALEKADKQIIQDTLTLADAQKQLNVSSQVGPSKQAQQFIDRILNSKTEKEALEIFREAEPQLKPADLPYLQTAGATARKNNQWVDPTKISDIVLAQVAAGDVFMRIEDNILFQAELKEDKIILKQIDGKSSVILSEDNKNQFMRSTDLNKTKPEVKEEPIIVSEESKQLVLNNIDEVSEFIKNSEKLTNLKEEVTSVDLDKLEDDLLNNLDC
jgi:hypothetical protein